MAKDKKEEKIKIFLEKDLTEIKIKEDKRYKTKNKDK